MSRKNKMSRRNPRKPALVIAGDLHQPLRSFPVRPEAYHIHDPDIPIRGYVRVCEVDVPVCGRLLRREYEEIVRTRRLPPRVIAGGTAIGLGAAPLLANESVEHLRQNFQATFEELTEAPVVPGAYDFRALDTIIRRRRPHFQASTDSEMFFLRDVPDCPRVVILPLSKRDVPNAKDAPLYWIVTVHGEVAALTTALYGAEALAVHVLASLAGNSAPLEAAAPLVAARVAAARNQLPVAVDPRIGPPPRGRYPASLEDYHAHLPRHPQNPNERVMPSVNLRQDPIPVSTFAQRPGESLQGYILRIVEVLHGALEARGIIPEGWRWPFLCISGDVPYEATGLATEHGISLIRPKTIAPLLTIRPEHVEFLPTQRNALGTIIHEILHSVQPGMEPSDNPDSEEPTAEDMAVEGITHLAEHLLLRSIFGASIRRSDEMCVRENLALSCEIAYVEGHPDVPFGDYATFARGIAALALIASESAPDPAAQALQWFSEHLRDSPADWQDRASRILAEAWLPEMDLEALGQIITLRLSEQRPLPDPLTEDPIRVLIDALDRSLELKVSSRSREFFCAPERVPVSTASQASLPAL